SSSYPATSWSAVPQQPDPDWGGRSGSPMGQFRKFPDFRAHGLWCIFNLRAAKGVCRNHRGEMGSEGAVGRHSLIYFFGLTIRNFTGGAAHVVQRASEPSLHQLEDIMKLSNLTFIAVALCAATVNWSISARADEVLKFRVVMHATFVQTHEVGDV